MLHAIMFVLAVALSATIGGILGLLLTLAWDGLLDQRIRCGRWARARLLLPRPKVLPMRAFGGTDVVLTEEDWRRHSKDMYPIRYFFQETVPNLFKTKESP